MVAISKEEASIIRKELGDKVFIAMTGRHKKSNRKRRYVEETRSAMRLLKQIRRGEYKD